MVTNQEAFAAGRADGSAGEPIKEGQPLDYYRGYTLEVAADALHSDTDSINCSADAMDSFANAIFALAKVLHKKLSENKKTKEDFDEEEFSAGRADCKSGKPLIVEEGRSLDYYSGYSREMSEPFVKSLFFWFKVILVCIVIVGVVMQL